MSTSGSRLAPLLSTHDLKVVCAQCCVQEKEITYKLKSVQHQCTRNLLLCKAKGSSKWRPVSRRPTFPKPSQYAVCYFFQEGLGCTHHKNRCTFARSDEEAAVWTFEKNHRLDHVLLCHLVAHCVRASDQPDIPEPLGVIESEPISITPNSAAESILQQFSGEFIEFCKDCFHGRPQKLTAKRWKPICCADAAHPWDPVLVYHLSENRGKHIYSQVRPLPQNYQFTYCDHVLQGKPCWHQAGHCKAAQSEVEMAVWKAEHSRLPIRPHLLHLSRREQTEPRQVILYCRVCLLHLPPTESFSKHCSSLEHAQLLSEDTTTKWTGRKPPHNIRAELQLCER